MIRGKQTLDQIRDVSLRTQKADFNEFSYLQNKLYILDIL